MSDYVLDASALLAFLQNEPGAQAVAPLLSRSAISAINLSEVVAKLADAGVQARSVLTALVTTTEMSVVPFDEALAYESGLLRPVTKPYGLSLGDRACLALARQLGIPAVSAEQVWKGLPATLGITFQFIR